MFKTLHLLCFSLIVLAYPQSVNAHGDIVYGARYYFPPGSTGTSHSHIYQIDPSGKNRVQLTFGNADDSDPVWEDNGKLIWFYRSENPTTDRYLMQIGPDGRNLKKIKFLGSNVDWPLDDESPTNDSYSPNGKYAVVSKSYSDPVYSNIVVRSSGAILGKINDNQPVLWLSNSEFADMDNSEGSDDSNSYQFTVYGLHGNQKSSIVLTNITPSTPLIENELGWHSPDWWVAFRPDRFMPGTFFGVDHARRGDLIFWIDPARKLIKLVTCADDEAWSPNGKFFCTCVDLGTAPYDATRVVWKSIMVLVNAKSLTVKVLQGGLVVCSGCDWRYGKRIVDE